MTEYSRQVWPGGIGQLEADAAVCVKAGGAAAARLSDQLAAEITIVLRGSGLDLVCRPARRDPAAAHEPAALPFEEVRKVAADRDLEVETDSLPPWLVMSIILVDATLRRSSGRAR